MFILNEENKTINLGNLTTFFEKYGKEKDIMFFILDLEGSKDEYDFKCLPLKYIEKTITNAVEVVINDQYIMRIPINWYILCGDKIFYENIEFINIQNIMNEEYNCISINPLSSYIPKWYSLKIINMFPNIEWISPKVKNEQYIVYPLSEKENPDCIIISPEQNKNNVILDISDIF